MTLRPALSGLRSQTLGRTLYVAMAACGMLLALAVLSWFARGSVVLRPSPTALGNLRTGLGNQVTAIRVEAGSRLVPAFIRDGQIWPRQPILPGSTVSILVETRAWLWNPWAATAQATYHLAAPRSPSVVDRHLRVALGRAPVVHLSGTSEGLSVRSSRNVPWSVLKTTAGSFPLRSATSKPGQHATALVRTRARAWEAWSQPQLLDWTTPPYLSVKPAWSLTGSAPALVVHFSAPVAKLPRGAITLSPSVSGNWVKLNPLTWEFHPVPGVTLYPGESLMLSVLGGRSGIEAVTGTYLAASARMQTSLPLGSVLRVQQLLATLGYLPLTWSGPTASAAATELRDAYSPPAGTFQWRFSNTPAPLQALWRSGQITPITTGVVMTFEAQHGLAVDGIVGPEVWKALIQAAEGGQVDSTGYSYVYVSETLPEQLTIWENGQTVLTSLTNTGIAATPTPVGTFPVYLRYTSQTMSGINPNGTRYVDPGVPWVNYFQGGNAVHGFVRAQYGFPQSLGCVELPVAEAAIAWQHMQYGTLVTVAAPGSARTP